MTTIKTKSHIINKLGSDMFYKLIVNMSPGQVLGTCRTRKSISEFCNEKLFENYAKDKLGVTIKPKKYTWTQVVREHAIFDKPNFPFSISKKTLINKINERIADIANYENYVSLKESEEGYDMDGDTFSIIVDYIGYIFGLGKFIVLYHTFDPREDEVGEEVFYTIQELNTTRDPLKIIEGGVYNDAIKPGLDANKIKTEMEKYVVDKYGRLIFVLSTGENITGLTENELYDKYEEDDEY